MTSTRLKKGDTVVVLSGKDKAKSGKILSVDRLNGKVSVEWLNIHHRFEKPRGNKAGAKVQFAGLMNASKVMLLCPSCNKPTRIGAKVLENGKKQRVCKNCEKGI